MGGLLFAQWFVTGRGSSDRGLIEGTTLPSDIDDMFPVIMGND